MKHATSARTLSSLVTLAAVSAGCGGTVVFEEQGGGDGGQGGSSREAAQQATSASGTSAQVTTGGDGGANVTSTAIAVTAVSSVTSASTGIPAACAGLVCGEDCAECNDFECVNGFCDELGACIPERVCPPPETQTLCYRLSEDEVCADLADAPFFLCRDCPNGKGCTFFGEIFEGPFLSPGECCYEVDGDCAPNP